MDYLNEEKYNKTKKKLKTIAILILIVGFSIGGFLIYRGVKGADTSKLENEKTKLEKMKNELKEQDITPSRDYEDGKAYDYYILKEVLDPSMDKCWQDEFKNNELTKEYCKLKNSDTDYNKHVYTGIGGMICWISFVVSMMILFTSKQRDVMAFHMQGMMPIGKEALEDIQPTASKVTKKHMHEIAPEVGEMAKEISKGIKEGLKEDEKEDK